MKEMFVHTSPLEQGLQTRRSVLGAARSNSLTVRPGKSCYERPGKTRWPHISVNG
jgi:hypothetical protein